MNELLYNFLNEIEDTHKIKEMTVEEFTKLVRANKLITEEDGKTLIDSFKKISEKKNPQDDGNDSDQRKKKYRTEPQNKINQNVKGESKKEKTENKKEKEKDDSIER